MVEPEWLRVLRVFWEENLAFDYGGDPEDWVTFFPENENLEGINPTAYLEDLHRTGFLEVEYVDLREDDSVTIDGFNAIQISDKGISAVLEWDRQKAIQEQESHLVELQEEYEEDRLERQQNFEAEQVTRTNEVNTGIGYLTIGLLIVSLSDVLVGLLGDYIPELWIHFMITVIVAAVIYRIIRSGLLSPVNTTIEK